MTAEEVLVNIINQIPDYLIDKECPAFIEDLASLIGLNPLNIDIKKVQSGIVTENYLGSREDAADPDAWDDFAKALEEAEYD